jgi:hypothetical protein
VSSILPSTILPLREADARAWLRGELEDEDLLSRIELREPTAVYGARMPGAASWRSGIVQTRFWLERGARIFIVRTSGIVMRHFLARGAQLSFQGPVESAAQWRMVFEPEAFHRYFHRCGIPNQLSQAA